MKIEKFLRARQTQNLDPLAKILLYDTPTPEYDFSEYDDVSEYIDDLEEERAGLDRSISKLRGRMETPPDDKMDEFHDEVENYSIVFLKLRISLLAATIDMRFDDNKTARRISNKYCRRFSRWCDDYNDSIDRQNSYEEAVILAGWMADMVAGAAKFLSPEVKIVFPKYESESDLLLLNPKIRAAEISIASNTEIQITSQTNVLGPAPFLSRLLNTSDYLRWLAENKHKNTPAMQAVFVSKLFAAESRTVS